MKVRRRTLPALEELTASWIRGLTPNTAQAYRGIIRNLQKWSKGGDLIALSEDRLVAFVEQIPTAKMKQRAVTALHSFYGYLLDVGYIDGDPTRRIYVRRMTHTANREILVRLGLRAPTAANLRWGDVLSSCIVDQSIKPLLRLRKGPHSAELIRRLIVQLRSCRNVNELRALLRQRVVRTQ